MLMISLMIMLVITMIERVSWARSVEMTLGAAVAGGTLAISPVGTVVIAASVLVCTASAFASRLAAVPC
jgi:hypothetical protein